MKATYWLILLLFAVFFAEVAFPENVEGFAFSTARLLQAPWILLTAIFIHADLGHLLSNIIGLYFFGKAVEEELGPKVMLVLFLAGGIAGSFASVPFYPPDTLALGASAGIFALVGAGMLLRPISFEAHILPIPLILIGVLFAIYNAVGFIAGTPGISFAGHFGGLAVGLLVGFRVRGWKRGLALIGVVVVILLLAPIVAGILLG